MRLGKLPVLGLLLCSLVAPAWAKSNIEQWLEDFQEQVRKNWTAPDASKSGKSTNTTVLRIVIKHSGELVSVAVKEFSPVDRADEIAIQTIEKSGPFKPLPDDFTAVFIRMYQDNQSE